MMSRCFAAVVVLAAGCAVVLAYEVEAAQPIDLFNGENLDGWYVVVQGQGRRPVQDIFTVDDGIIHAYADHEPNSRQPFAGLITETSYNNFHLELEYKWGEKKFAPRHDYVRDAGIIFHMHDDDPFWPSGVEMQIQQGDTGDIWVIGTQVTSKEHGVEGNYSPDGEPRTRGARHQRYARFARSYCWERPGWNHVEITVEGDHALYRVNGHVVNEASDMRRWDAAAERFVRLDRGNILLQAEGAEVLYRNLRLTPLD